MISYQSRQSGFTLVELAIVLMIIGLLIGGILRGQELLNNARISSTIQQVTAYDGAAVTFRDAYSQSAGDIATAINRIPGCTAGNFCVNGNGNGILGQMRTGAAMMNLYTGSAPLNVETTMFWKHLALAHLISGVKPSGNPDDPGFGETHPSAKIAGGFMAVHGYQAAAGSIVGVWLVLTNKVSGASGSSAYVPDGGNPVSPVQARLIDTKMDDGMPDMGDVVAPDTDDSCDAGVPAQYLTHERNTCVLIFRISG